MTLPCTGTLRSAIESDAIFRCQLKIEFIGFVLAVGYDNATKLLEFSQDITNEQFEAAQEAVKNLYLNYATELI